MASSDQIRLLLVEDVPQVAQYIRSLLNSQAHIKLLDVLNDGSKAAAAAQQLRPDVMLVDALLQGRIKGPALVEQLQRERVGVPVIMLTVPQNPVQADPERGIEAVLSMPFSGYDLMNKVTAVHQAYKAAGGVCQYQLFEGSEHEWVATPGPQTDRARELVKAFIARQLKAQS